MDRTSLPLKYLLLLLFLFINTLHANSPESAFDIKHVPIFAVAISQQNPDIVYATSRGCIYRIEKGECFKIEIEEEKNTDITRIAIDPINAGKVYALIPNVAKILVTEDTGKTWRNVNIPQNLKFAMFQHFFWEYSAIAIDPSNPKLIIISGKASPRVLGELSSDKYECILFSSDRGSSWRISTDLRPSLFGTEPKVNCIAMTKKTILIAGTKGIYRYREDEKGKTHYDGHLKNSPKDIIELTIDPSNSQRFLGISSANEIFETTTSGDSFAFLCQLDRKTNCIAIDPQSSQSFLVGTEKGLLHTFDNGKTWQETGHDTLKKITIYSIAINASNNNLVYAGTAQGLFISENGGNDWQIYKTYREKEAELLLFKADSLDAIRKYTEALDTYKRILNDFPSIDVAPVVKEKVKNLEIKMHEEIIAEIRGKIQQISIDKVRNAIAKLGLDEYQSNALANAIENLPSNTAATVMKDGLGMPLSDNECSAEYRKLTLHQKFYAVNCYLRKCDKDLDKAYKAGEKISEEDFWYQIAGELNISEEIVHRLLNIKPENLLKK